MNPFAVEIETIRSGYLPEQQASLFRPASEADLRQLEQLNVPAVVRDFYAVAEPARLIEADGVFLLPISLMLDANQHTVPGVAASRYGYVVIAKTVSGDAYCLDSNALNADGQPAIYLINHERVNETATLAEITQQSRLVAHTFQEFLEKFAAKMLPYDFYLAA